MQRIATQHSLKAIIVGKAIYQTTLQAKGKKIHENFSATQLYHIVRGMSLCMCVSNVKCTILMLVQYTII